MGDKKAQLAPMATDMRNGSTGRDMVLAILIDRGAIMTAVAALFIKSEINMVTIKIIAKVHTTCMSSVIPVVTSVPPIGIIAPKRITTGQSICRYIPWPLKSLVEVKAKTHKRKATIIFNMFEATKTIHIAKIIKEWKVEKVSIIIGSKSDAEIMDKTKEILDELEVPYEFNVISAHRDLEKLRDYVSQSEEKISKYL